MNSFIISYDLISPSKDYSTLYDAIKKYGTYAKITDSFWIINTNNTSVQIRDNLKSYVDSNDRLFIAKLNGEAAWLNLNQEISNWLNNNL